MSPRQQDAQYGGCKKTPFHRSFQNEKAEEKQHEHESSHIDGTRRSRLGSPILPDLLIDLHILLVCLFHGLVVGGNGDGSASFHIRNKEGPSLADAVTPLSDVIFAEPAPLWVCSRFERSLATHGLLTIFIRVVKTGQIGHERDDK